MCLIHKLHKACQKLQLYVFGWRKRKVLKQLARYCSSLCSCDTKNAVCCCKYSFATLLHFKCNLKYCMGSLIPDSDTESPAKVGKITIEMFIQMVSRVIYLTLVV